MSEIEVKLSHLEKRLGFIEERLGILPIRQPTPAPASGTQQQNSQTVSQAPANAGYKPFFPSKANPAVQIAPREAKPGNWLGIIGVICFVLAAAFIVKLSIDSGWLTPERQIGLAVLLGLSLVGIGFAILDSDREYASLLPGAGLIVLYLAVFASFRVYHLISFELALAATTVVSGVCVWLYTKIRHDVYPITAAVGAYVAPVLLGMASQVEFTLLYYVICSIAFAIISIWVNSRMLTMISAYLAIFITSAIGFQRDIDNTVAIMLALHFGIFTIGTYLFTRSAKRALTEAEAWCFFPVLMTFYAMEYYFVDRIYPGLAPWISLGFAALLLCLYLYARRKFTGNELGSTSMIQSFLVLVCFHSVYLELLPLNFKPWLFVLFVLGLAFLPLQLSRLGRGASFKIPGLALTAVFVMEYVRIVFNLFTKPETSWIVVAMAGLGSLWVLLILKSDELEERTDLAQLILGSAHLLAIMGLYRIAEDNGSFIVSVSWLMYALCVIAYSFTRRDSVMAKSAMLVLGFAAAKALLYDASSAPTVLRIFCLLLTGAALYGSGFLIRKIAEWK